MADSAPRKLPKPARSGMERRARASRAGRRAAGKRRAKAKAERTRLDMGPAWATVVYKAGEGYALEALHEDKEAAEDAAALGTRRALDDAAYAPGSPYTVVFAAPVLLDQGYTRDTLYYATVEGDPQRRTVALWRTVAEAAAAADGETCVYVGGPAQLAAREPAPPEPRARTTKAERRAAKRLARAKKGRPDARS